MGYAQKPEVFPFICTTAILGINNRVNKSLGITVELKITSQVTNFIKQILSFLAYGGSSICEHAELNLFSHTPDG
jgi:hypothetical protein